METTITEAADTPFGQWEEGLLSAREAIRLLVDAEYVAADAAFRAAEQRKKAVRAQLETIVRTLDEPLVHAGLELAWRDGSLAASYPAQTVDWAVRTLHTLLAALLGCPQVPFDGPAAADAQPTYLVPHDLLSELTATLEELAQSREERPRAGALYITKEDATQRRGRSQPEAQS